MIDSPSDDKKQPGVGTTESSPASAPVSESKPRREPSIGQEVNRFISDIDSLAETLPLALLAIQGAQRSAATTLMEYEQEHCKVEQEGKTRKVRVPGEKWQRYSKLMKRVARPGRAGALVPRGFLVALVSQYDAFLGALLRTLFLLKPETLSASDRSLTFAELVNFGSVDAAREHLIEKEIEGVLRKSHAEQFDWMENKFGVELRKDLPIWQTFIELTERRNLFVHTSGIISGQYLDVCKRHKVSLPKGAAIGKQLGVTNAYFAAAHNALLEIGVKLAHVLWRKLRPEDRKAADANLTTVTFDLLSEERYELARVLLDFATVALKKHSSDQQRRMLVVNRAQAYKWLGLEEEAQRIVSAEDWSATSDTFRLAEAVIGDRFDRAAELMIAIGPKGTPEKSDYREWPLFRMFRSSPEFLAAYEKVFAEPFSAPLQTATPSREPAVDGSAGETA
jgi:hypothetical protein